MDTGYNSLIKYNNMTGRFGRVTRGESWVAVVGHVAPQGLARSALSAVGREEGRRLALII